MKRTLFVTMIVLMGLFFAVGSYAADVGSKAMTPGNEVFRASHLIGAEVKNLQGERLGKITDLTIDSRGNTLFAVISPAAMPMLSSKLIPVPINALQFENEGKTALLDITKEKLQSAPHFTKNEWPDMTNERWTEDTYRYYGVSPSWKGTEPGMHEKDMEHGGMMEKKDMPGY